MRHGAAVVPVGRAGAYSRSLYAQLTCPYPDLGEKWAILNDETDSVDQVGDALFRILMTLW